MLFSRRQPSESARLEVQGDLVELLLGLDEVGRKRMVLLALQTGELRRSEVKDFMRLVSRLESAGRPVPAPAQNAG